MRDPLSKRLRYEVMRRDGHVCRYCGAKAPDAELTVDHVVPVALGGKNEPGNLVTACRDCNAGKSSTAADSAVAEAVSDDAIRWGKAMQRAADIQAQERQFDHDAINYLDGEWERWTDNWDRQIPRPANWKDSISAWMRAGLNVGDMEELIDVAMRRGIKRDDTWRYFCGCCWRLIEQRQEIARGLIEEETPPAVPEPELVPPPPDLIKQFFGDWPKGAV